MEIDTQTAVADDSSNGNNNEVSAENGAVKAEEKRDDMALEQEVDTVFQDQFLGQDYGPQKGWQRKFWALTIPSIESQCENINVRRNYFDDMGKFEDVVNSIWTNKLSGRNTDITHFIAVREYHSVASWRAALKGYNIPVAFNDNSNDNKDVNRSHFHISLGLKRKTRIEAKDFFNFAPNVTDTDDLFDDNEETGVVGDIIVHISNSKSRMNSVSQVFFF